MPQSWSTRSYSLPTHDTVGFGTLAGIRGNGTGGGEALVPKGAALLSGLAA